MKIIRKVIDYIKDDQFKITYVDNSVDVVNYDKIIEVKSEVITIKKENITILIEGNDLKLTKLLDNEVLIKGIIKEIIFKE